MILSYTVIENIFKLRLLKTQKMKEIKEYVDVSINEIESFLDSYKSGSK
jgi:hypothetical protein